MKKCMNCESILTRCHQIKFCSNQCQHDYQYRQWVKQWRDGEISGNIGITAKNISQHLKRYLEEKFKNQCSVCGWHKKHPITGVIPFEIDHIDGNADNNSEGNLQLLCPNCHAPTPFYKNLNKGNGRKWRMNKYIKNEMRVTKSVQIREVAL